MTTKSALAWLRGCFKVVMRIVRNFDVIFSLVVGDVVVGCCLPMLFASGFGVYLLAKWP